MEESNIILVDGDDRETGVMEKMEAHRKGILHRAFSVFIFNRAGEILLQQRAENKYHSGGLWTNACCSHPSPGEDTETAAHRRLGEEMGFDTKIEKIFEFTYKASFANGLTEHEYDHVFAGEYNGPVLFDTTEVQAAEFVSVDKVRKSLEERENMYSAWFIIAFSKVLPWWEKNYKK